VFVHVYHHWYIGNMRKSLLQIRLMLVSDTSISPLCCCVPAVRSRPLVKQLPSDVVCLVVVAASRHAWYLRKYHFHVLRGRPAVPWPETIIQQYTVVWQRVHDSKSLAEKSYHEKYSKLEHWAQANTEPLQKAFSVTVTKDFYKDRWLRLLAKFHLAQKMMWLW